MNDDNQDNDNQSVAGDFFVLVCIALSFILGVVVLLAFLPMLPIYIVVLVVGTAVWALARGCDDYTPEDRADLSRRENDRSS